MSNVKCQIVVCLRHVLYKIIIPFPLLYYIKKCFAGSRYGKAIIGTFVIFNLSFVIILAGCGDLEGELASLTISPPSATIGINQSHLFTVTAINSVDQIVSVSPSWSVIGEIGTVTPRGGLFTAGSATGEGTVVASYEGKSASASVTVTDKCWIEGIVSDEIGKLVQGIRVYLKNTAISNFTDSTGEYSLPGISAETYDVWTEDPKGNYKPSSREAITVASGEKRTGINFILYYYSRPPDSTLPEL